MSTPNEAQPTPVPDQRGTRFDYVKYDAQAQSIQDGFKEALGNVAAAIESLPAGRAASLALTRLEEVYMWIGKAIRDDQIKRNGSAPLQEERKDG